MHCFHQAGVPLKLGLVGEILVVLVVLPTKWKFSGLLFVQNLLQNVVFRKNRHTKLVDDMQPSLKK